MILAQLAEAMPAYEIVARWVGIFFCLSQSAMFSGLNLAFFSISRLRLEAEAEQGKPEAERILKLREDANFLLCTILWGNVSVNVLLALLSESVLAGLGGFIFSTVGITFFGEIGPQAYFSRHAMRMGSLLTPVIRFYQILLFPFAKPSALILDGWVGPEGPSYMRERDVEIILQKHIHEEDSEIGATEGRGALNFLDLDDRLVIMEGHDLDPQTIFQFPTKLDLPVIPELDTPEGEKFLERLKKIDKKYVVVTDENDYPHLVMDAEAFVFTQFTGKANLDIYKFAHRPVVVDDPAATVESVLDQLVVDAEHKNDRVIDRDVILFWTPDSKRIITGADILGRLLQGIARRVETPATTK
ncbi:MAG: metal transporter CNNM [Verrucomicrobiales bacterium]|jgi:metal transporter CNNM